MKSSKYPNNFLFLALSRYACMYILTAFILLKTYVLALRHSSGGLLQQYMLTDLLRLHKAGSVKNQWDPARASRGLVSIYPARAA